MGAHMRIRQATLDDLDAVLGIIADGQAALAGLGIDQWQNGYPSHEMIEADIAGGHTWLAVADEAERPGAADDALDAADGQSEAEPPTPGTILGTMAYYAQGEPDYDHVTEGAWLTDSANDVARGPVTYAVLHRLAVSARARRRGVAHALLADGIERARAQGLASVRVDTHEGNIPMQRGFEACGFKRCCAIEISFSNEATNRRIGFERVL